jgi:hypothetical protein
MLKRTKESELKELKLKYDLLKGRYDSDVYGKKNPKKPKEVKQGRVLKLTNCSRKFSYFLKKLETIIFKI